jgi:hypothetical protein
MPLQQSVWDIYGRSGALGGAHDKVVVGYFGCSSNLVFRPNRDAATDLRQAGDKVCLSGAGWAEPNPVCRYTFAFDGATVAPDQPDGLFGPPITNFIVPAATDGNHNVRVQLRLNSPDNLLQERTVPFKVVSAPKDPWTASTTSGATINLKFDPTDICDLGSCDKIVFLQVDRRVGVKDDGTEVGQPTPTGALMLKETRI